MPEGVPEPPNGWSRFERVIVYRLDKLDAELRDARAEVRAIRDEDIGKLKIDVAMLKVKAGIWGGAGGVIAAAVIVASVLLR